MLRISCFSCAQIDFTLQAEELLHTFIHDWIVIQTQTVYPSKRPNPWVWIVKKVWGKEGPCESIDNTKVMAMVSSIIIQCNNAL